MLCVKKILAGAVLLAFPLAAGAQSVSRSSLLTIEGKTAAISVQTGEGGLDLVSVAVELDDPAGERLEILLGPESVLTETGFSVEVGDRVRARIFPADSGPVLVHKILNISQNTTVRLRTLYRIPLWSGSGRWQGGLAGNAAGHRNHHPGARRAGYPGGN